MNLKYYPPLHWDEPFRFGDYELLSLLGSGGMGQVFEARRVKRVGGKEVRMPTPFALKVPSVQLLRSDSTIAEQLLAEAVAAAKVHHANVVSLLDVGEVHGIPYLVMDYLEGQGLDDLLEQGPIHPDQAVQIGIEVATGLEAIHKAGLVHRDLKPSNIFITESGRVKLLDLGIAKAVDAQTRLTGTGMSKGTPGYMAPEQLIQAPLDSRVDLFALGAVLAEAVLGEPVFIGATLIQLIMLMPAAEKHVASQSIGPRINTLKPGLGDVITRCLRQDPDARPDGAAGVRKALAVLSLPGRVVEPGVDRKPKKEKRPIPVESAPGNATRKVERPVPEPAAPKKKKKKKSAAAAPVHTAVQDSPDVRSSLFGMIGLRLVAWAIAATAPIMHLGNVVATTYELDALMAVVVLFMWFFPLPGILALIWLDRTHTPPMGVGFVTHTARFWGVDWVEFEGSSSWIINDSTGHWVTPEQALAFRAKRGLFRPENYLDGVEAKRRKWNWKAVLRAIPVNIVLSVPVFFLILAFGPVIETANTFIYNLGAFVSMYAFFNALLLPFVLVGHFVWHKYAQFIDTRFVHLDGDIVRTPKGEFDLSSPNVDVNLAWDIFGANLVLANDTERLVVRGGHHVVGLARVAERRLDELRSSGV